MAPKDLQPGDICTAKGGSNCDFNYTGFRVPLIVISPFAKKNYVSHTPADYTAILKFIEKRFLNGTSLTLRDAAQIDMTEFFDFEGVPWATAPTPPVQATNGASNPQTLRSQPVFQSGGCRGKVMPRGHATTPRASRPARDWRGARAQLCT